MMDHRRRSSFSPTGRTDTQTATGAGASVAAYTSSRATAARCSALLPDPAAAISIAIVPDQICVTVPLYGSSNARNSSLVVSPLRRLGGVETPVAYLQSLVHVL
eukprot:COSAG01_NODE_36085_length_522_cov_1.354610_1_plen_103_part_01